MAGKIHVSIIRDLITEGRVLHNLAGIGGNASRHSFALRVAGKNRKRDLRLTRHYGAKARFQSGLIRAMGPSLGAEYRRSREEIIRRESVDRHRGAENGLPARIGHRELRFQPDDGQIRAEVLQCEAQLRQRVRVVTALVRQAKRALEIDPLSLPIIRDFARCFYHARRYDEAITQYMKTLELEPKHYRLNSWLDMAYEQKGLYDQAFEVRLKAMTVIGFDPETIEARKKAYAVSGWKGYWRKELELTEEWARQEGGYVTPYSLARMCARLGDKNRALGWLEKAYSERSDHLVLLKVDPIFDELRADPRFLDLLRRVGFTS